MKWETVELGSVAEVFNGKTPSKAEKRSEGSPVLKIKDVDELGNFRGFESFVEPALHQKYSKKSVRAGDTLVLNAAHSATHVGSKICRAPEEAIGALATGEWLMVRCYAETDPRFVNHWMTSEPARRQIRDAIKGIHLYPKDVARFSIPIPPLEEQRRIAGILDAADALRRRRREALALLDTLPGAIFAEMFGDPLVEPGGHDLRPLEEFVDPNRKITYGILKPGPDIADGVPYIRVVDMKDGTVRLGELKRTTDEIAESYRRSSLRSGDLLMSIRGHVGRTATVPENCHGANITQDTARLALVKAIPEFIEGYLLLPSVQHWMAQRTKGVAVTGINLGDLKKLPIPMLPFEQQDEFRRTRRQVLNQREAMAGHLAELDTLFASLQSRAFAGAL